MSVIICLMPCNDESRHRSMVVCASARIKRFARTSCILVGTCKFILDRRRDFLRHTMAENDDDDGLFDAAVVAPVAIDIPKFYGKSIEKFKTERRIQLTFFHRYLKEYQNHSCQSIFNYFSFINFLKCHNRSLR